jgi:hypothetical protein
MINIFQGDSGGPLVVMGKDGRWFLAGIIRYTNHLEISRIIQYRVISKYPEIIRYINFPLEYEYIRYATQFLNSELQYEI